MPSTTYRPRSLFAFLSVLPVAVLVPALVLGGSLLLLQWQGHRAEMQRELEATSRALAGAVDREMAGSLRELERVAESPALMSGNLAALQQQLAALVAQRRAWRNLVLLGADGNVRLSATARPAVPAAAGLSSAIGLTTAGVSDLFIDPDSGQPMVAVATPAQLGDDRALLVAFVDPHELSRFLAEHQSQTDGLALVVDRQRRVIARSRQMERFVAQPVTETYDRLMQSAPAGVSLAISLDEQPVVAAWQRLTWGWTVVVSVPQRAFSAPMTNAMSALLAFGIALLLASVLGTLAYARRIANELRNAGAQAQKLAAGETIEERQTGLVEIDALLAAMRESTARLSAVLHELRASESVARERLADLEQADRRKDEFLAMLAHELRNPLAPISTAAEMLKGNQHDTRTLARAREVIVRQVAHLTRLVDDLLDVSRITQGKITLAKTLLDLRSVVGVAVNAALAVALPRKQTINVSTPPEPVWLEGDLVRLTQVVDNLLANALKYSTAGSTVDVRLQQEDGMAVLRVHDQGIGIAPDMLERIFDVFVQGDESLDRAGGGLGLGLTLVRELAQLHGGSAHAESDGPGTGATFVVRLPLTRLRPEPIVVQPAPAAAEPAQRRGRILIVDDNRDAAEGLAWILEQDNHLVRLAYDGRTAVRMAREFKPQVVLLDIGLPVMNGYQVAEQLRSFPETYRAVVIAITGYGQASDRERALQSGFDFHLVKPAEPTQVRRMVTEALTHSDESRTTER